MIHGMLKKCFMFYLAGAILLCGFCAFTEVASMHLSKKKYNLDSIACPRYIKRLITYNKIYPFIRYNQNYIEWNEYSSIANLFDKIKQTSSRKLRVLHIGDSHVQADIFTGYIRNEMQDIMYEGGRGFVFPYAAASTHAAYDYKTSCKGQWEYSRNVQPLPAYDMGITGATIHTEDSTASFKFIFNKSALKGNCNVLKIYCKCSPESFDLKLKATGLSAPLYIDCNTFNDKLYIEINLPAPSDTLEFFVNKTDTGQKYFECYGLLLETNEDKGVLYNSVGINGAGLKSILKENLLLYQLSELNPDLVVIDVGLNDFYKMAFDSKQIEKNLSDIIDIIQRASPDASIILSDGQDVYYNYWDEANCKTYATLMREIAFRKGCAFYDYYYVSGGQYSMLNWLKNKLAGYDKVHLTNPGYILRGELFLNALLNSYYMSLIKPGMKSLIATKDIPDTTKVMALLANKNLPEIKDTDVTTSSIKELTQVWKTETFYYKIKSGDNLGSIAKKYGVTLKQLQSWNGLQGTAIAAGKTLVIYVQKVTYNNGTQVYAKNQVTTQTPTNSATQIKIKTQPQVKQKTIQTKITSTSTTKETVKYTVIKGDNLWCISKKYGVTVDQIKTLNGLTSDAIKLGMVLIISK
jgi:LysM repeat protein/lysophospholipase L1-like esterase